MQIPRQIDTIEQLESLYRTPGPGAADKVLTSLNDGMAAFIDRCPFVVLATTDGRGVGRRLAARRARPASCGASTIATWRSPTSTATTVSTACATSSAFPWAGLLMVDPRPGRDAADQRPGGAHAPTPRSSPGSRPSCATPKLAVVIETDEVYGHCAKAFKRGNMWRPETWVLTETETPDLATMYACVWNLDEDEISKDLAESYVEGLAVDRR